MYGYQKPVRERSATSMKGIKGTRKLHVARPTQNPDYIEIRPLSCFCASCLSNANGNEGCCNKEYVGNWQKVKCEYPKTSTG